jgi:rhodanese-related sulfurtransferase
VHDDRQPSSALGVDQEDFDARRARDDADVVVVDVRRGADFLDDPRMIPGARRGDPDTLDEWSTTLPADRDIIVYCVRGGSVSQSVVPKLRERGFRARYLIGGLTAWKGRGGKTKLTQ